MLRFKTFFSLVSVVSVGIPAIALAAPLHLADIVPDASGKSILHKVHNCHADTRYNYVPQINRQANHRHSNNCGPVVFESGGSGSHCHADGRQHRHNRVGTTVHSHFGDSCRVDVWEKNSGGSGSGKECIKIGPLAFCK